MLVDDSEINLQGPSNLSCKSFDRIVEVCTYWSFSEEQKVPRGIITFRGSGWVDWFNFYKGKRKGMNWIWVT